MDGHHRVRQVSVGVRPGPIVVARRRLRPPSTDGSGGRLAPRSAITSADRAVRWLRPRFGSLCEVAGRSREATVHRPSRRPSLARRRRSPVASGGRFAPRPSARARLRSVHLRADRSAAGRAAASLTRVGVTARRPSPPVAATAFSPPEGDSSSSGAVQRPPARSASLGEVDVLEDRDRRLPDLLPDLLERTGDVHRARLR